MEPRGWSPRQTGRVELLLLSNSTNHGQQMLEHAATPLREMAGDDPVLFVPYALAQWDEYGDRAEAAFGALGIRSGSAHRADDPARAILDAEVVMMGGGNTFRLLDALLGFGVVDGLRERVRTGATRYIGSSAGTNVACPTIRTTNDMPICQPETLDALGLVPFQINPHYVDADPDSTYMGETRAHRLREFLEENPCSVLALYEGSWLGVSDHTASVAGRSLLFERSGVEALDDGHDVSHLLSLTPRFGRS